MKAAESMGPAVHKVTKDTILQILDGRQHQFKYPSVG